MSGRFLRVKKYRIVQLHSKLHNETWRPPGMATYVCGLIMGQVSCLYMVLTSWASLPYLAVCMFAVFGNNLFFHIHYFIKILSSPYLKSREFVSMGRQQRNKWMQTYLRSCYPIRLSMGNGTFFDKLTSLNVWQFCIDRLVTILLL